MRNALKIVWSVSKVLKGKKMRKSRLVHPKIVLKLEKHMWNAKKKVILCLKVTSSEKTNEKIPWKFLPVTNENQQKVGIISLSVHFYGEARLFYRTGWKNVKKFDKKKERKEKWKDTVFLWELLRYLDRLNKNQELCGISEIPSVIWT